METLVTDDEVARAITTPPVDTRAYFRGRCLAKYTREVVAASWDSVIFDIGRESLVRVPMLEPERGTKQHVGGLLDRSATATDLIDAITGRRPN
jgi:proteasome accessory factor A